MFFENSGGIIHGNPLTPGPFGIDHHRNSLAALAETPRFVDPNFGLQPFLCHQFFEFSHERFGAFGAATLLARLFLVGADEEMFFEFHGSRHTLCLDARQ